MIPWYIYAKAVHSWPICSHFAWSGLYSYSKACSHGQASVVTSIQQGLLGMTRNITTPGGRMQSPFEQLQ